MEITFRKKDFNDIYLPYLDDQSRFLVLYGGGGSGKSQFIAQRYLYRCLKEPYFRLVYCRKIGRTIRQSQFQLFKDLITRAGMEELFAIKEANMEISCINGNMMISSGLDDPEKIKSIQEPTDIWCEEATEFDKEDIIQLNLRLRTKKGVNQIVLSFNPINTDHWIYNSFFVKKDFTATIVKSTYLDNRFLPPSYKQQLDNLKNQDENFYNVYCLGEWGGKMKGLIYPTYKLTDHIPQFADIIYGLDFGFNDPFALVRVGIVDRRHVYIQQLQYKTGLTNSDIITFLRSQNIGKATIYADSARPEAIEEIYRAGFNIKPCVKGKDSVNTGIQFVKGLDINILDDGPELIKEMNNYRWEKDKAGKSIEGKPLDILNHACDAFRYALFTHIGRPTGAFRVSVI